MVSNLLIGYEIKKKGNIKFSSALFPRLVTFKSGSVYYSGEQQIFYLFYRFYEQTVDLRLDWLILERYGGIGKILEFFGSEKSMRKTLLQVYCLIDWLSFLSFNNLTNESQTSEYFNKKYPNISTAFVPIYTRDSLENITTLVKKIWLDLSLGEKSYFLLDSDLARIFSTFSVERRKQIFAKFLIEAERLHAERLYAQRQFSFPIHWSEEINTVINSIKNK